jgi:hypothetical protein
MTYIDHAYSFIDEFSPYFKMLYRHKYLKVRDLEKLISRFNTVHRRNYIVRAGCSRMVIIADDFVIKMDYDGWGAGQAGSVSDEVEAFELIKEAGFEYLFAEPTPFYYGDQMMIIMPRVKDVNWSRGWAEACEDLTEEEYSFVEENFFDLHGGNFGFDKCGNLVIFDYAWRREECSSCEEYSSSWEERSSSC